jgi:hypothetical protein
MITAAGAFVGSLLASLLAPWLLHRWRREQERKDAIRDLIPKLMVNRSDTLTSDPDARLAAHVEQMRLHTELQLHLRSNEWQIDRMAAAVSFEDDSARAGFLQAVFPTAAGYWLRGEKTADQAREYFETETGLVIRRLPGAPPK